MRPYSHIESELGLISYLKHAVETVVVFRLKQYAFSSVTEFRSVVGTVRADDRHKSIWVVQFLVKVIGVVGYSNSGKTTLVEHLIPRLNQRGCVATVKSIHHDIDFDEKGKDTYRHRMAGAQQVTGVMRTKSFQINTSGKGTSTGTHRENTVLVDLLDDLADNGFKYVVIEGFKQSAIPKLIVGDIPIKKLSGPVIHRTTTDPTQALEPIVNGIEKLSDYETHSSLRRTAGTHPAASQSAITATFIGQVYADSDSELNRCFGWKSDYVSDTVADIATKLKRREKITGVSISIRGGVIHENERVVSLCILSTAQDSAYEALKAGFERLKIDIEGFRNGFDGDYRISGNFP
ncbi:molybdopterin-guanine dinucleotide biosynthesis protein B [halophilic archaeon]|nr:molybdopterin-guanine dinucleotide biosynthesis protein B [halophilic archaeon]